MKTINRLSNLKTVFILLMAITTFSCHNDDDTVPATILPPPTYPNSFSLLNVSDAATEVAVTPSFNWEAATDPNGDAITYTLFLGTEANPTTVYADNLNTTTFNVSERLNIITQYYWKVEAHDDNGNTTSSSTFSFTTRNLNVSNGPVTESAAFSTRSSPGFIGFNDKLWILNGFHYTEDIREDFWNSEDGETWTEVTPTSAVFSARYSPMAFVFDNKIWVIGGYDGADYKNDVWSSEDGVNWTEVTPNAPFSGRSFHSTVVFDNKMWVMAGRDDSIDRKNDVWYSENGLDWTEATPNAEFSPRAGQSLTVFNDKMWIIAGYDGSYQNDVWSSEDGVTWTQVTTNEELPVRISHSAFVYDDKLWLVGGSTDLSLGANDDIWYTADGINWTQGSNAPFAKTEHATTVFDNKVWFLGGIEPLVGHKNDVWFFD